MIKHRYKHQQGFTLLEVILVIAFFITLSIVGFLVWHRHHLAQSSKVTSSQQSSSFQKYWLVEDTAVAKMQQNGLQSSKLTYFFNNPRTLLIDHGISGRTAVSSIEQLLPSASLVESFASYSILQQAFKNNSVSSTTKYILYDNENWSATPISEQADPISYEQKVENLVHQHNLKLIFTPAADLASKLAGTNNKDKYDSYIKLGLASRGAKYTDIFEIQAQQDEGKTGFSQFVLAAANQIKQSNPNCSILVGIGSNPGGRTVSSQTIFDDYNSVSSKVNGFWFNIPGKNSQPQIAVDFFNMLYAHLHS